MNKGIFMRMIGILFIIAMIILPCKVACADESSVTRTQDNINITSTASWIDVNGSTTDAKGNPYVNVNFKIDTTKMTSDITNQVANGGDVDVVLVIDNTQSYEKEFPNIKKAAGEFVDTVMALTIHKVRVGVIDFGSEAFVRSELSTDKVAVRKAIDNLIIDPVLRETHMHLGVYKAQEMLEKSMAKTKVMIILSDEQPNKIIGKDELDYEGAKKAIGEQLQEASKKIDGLKIVTIGYTEDQHALDILQSYATKDSFGKKLFYTAKDNIANITHNITNVFGKIGETVTSYASGNSLIAYIPKEMNIVEGAQKANDKVITTDISINKNVVSFNWNNNKLENKVYEVSYVATLDKTKLTSKQLSGQDNININGNTIDVNVDSLGSSFFSYGDQGIIKLTSPKLNLKGDSNTSIKDSNNSSEPELDESPKTADSFEILMIVTGVLSATIATMAVALLKYRRY